MPTRPCTWEGSCTDSEDSSAPHASHHIVHSSVGQVNPIVLTNHRQHSMLRQKNRELALLLIMIRGTRLIIQSNVSNDRKILDLYRAVCHTTPDDTSFIKMPSKIFASLLCPAHAQTSTGRSVHRALHTCHWVRVSDRCMRAQKRPVLRLCTGV